MCIIFFVWLSIETNLFFLPILALTFVFLLSECANKRPAMEQCSVVDAVAAGIFVASQSLRPESFRSVQVVLCSFFERSKKVVTKSDVDKCWTRSFPVPQTTLQVEFEAI